MAREDFRQQKPIDFYSQFFKLCIEKEFSNNQVFWDSFLEFCKLDRVVAEETLLQLLPEGKKQEYFESKTRRFYK